MPALEKRLMEACTTSSPSPMRLRGESDSLIKRREVVENEKLSGETNSYRHGRY